ncbi:hypothetical protein HAHE_33480 [Haloferula helveola]|uniref:Uncharacterized protein n=1 Tax=Haloferula helveola TaxID=490095 RepID=A0ABN6H709_9BACT|nr:hypothetical protein HAHE_33480 [Haloferula helveola]
MGLGEEHPGLDGGYRIAIKQQKDLILENRRRHGVDGSHLMGGFRYHAGDGGEAEYPEVLESFEIGLQTCTRRAVGAGDGQGDRA